MISHVICFNMVPWVQKRRYCTMYIKRCFFSSDYITMYRKLVGFPQAVIIHYLRYVDNKETYLFTMHVFKKKVL
jgi:hypothetical protein